VSSPSNQHVHVGLDVGEHPANDVALACSGLAAYTAPASAARAAVPSEDLLS